MKQMRVGQRAFWKKEFGNQVNKVRSWPSNPNQQINKIMTCMALITGPVLVSVGFIWRSPKEDYHFKGILLFLWLKTSAHRCLALFGTHCFVTGLKSGLDWSGLDWSGWDWSALDCSVRLRVLVNGYNRTGCAAWRWWLELIKRWECKVIKDNNNNKRKVPAFVCCLWIFWNLLLTCFYGTRS